jgi:hypothetical protein
MISPGGNGGDAATISAAHISVAATGAHPNLLLRE